jgi:hypothetical protein
VRALFLGGAALETGVLWSAVSLALAATFLAKRQPLAAVGFLAATLFAMAFVRHRVREAVLGPFWVAEGLSVRPQLGLLLVFVVVLVAGIAVLAWMIRRFVSATASRD